MAKLISAFVLVTTIAVSQYNTEIKQNQLTVYGNATVSYNSDRAMIQATFVGLGSSLDAALQDLRPKVTAAITELRAIGIPANQIRTSRFNAGENKGSSWWTSSKDFKIMTGITVTIDSLELLDSVAACLLKLPVDNVTSIAYYLTDIEEKKLAVQQLAAENARKNAELIAKTLGAIIVKPLLIDNQSVNAPRVEITASYRPPIISSTQRIPVSASIRVIFEMGYPKQ